MSCTTRHERESESHSRVSLGGVGILIPIALFASLSRRGLGTLAKAPPAKRSKKGYGDENVALVVLTLAPDLSKTALVGFSSNGSNRPSTRIIIH